MPEQNQDLTTIAVFLFVFASIFFIISCAVV